jgi:LacI family transcriptional regulator
VLQEKAMIKPQRNIPTIRDIANLVGVHHSTVSRALNVDQKQKISPKVVRAVEKAAEKLGYLPNIAASTLKRKRSFVLGVLIPDITNPIFPPIIRGIQDVAESEGYTVITANTDDDPTKEQDAFRMMRSRGIEGIIIATAHLSDPTVEECILYQIPFVLANRTVHHDNVNAVILDEDCGVRAALKHLCDLGHTAIACISGPTDTSTGAERLQSFHNFMKIRELPVDLIAHATKFSIEAGQDACKRLLKRNKPFTAVLAGNDLIALGCIDALNAVGRQVPDDVSVVGANDIPMLSRMVPALTTINTPMYKMGSQSATTLFEVINGYSSDPIVMRMQPRLIVRNSTAPPKQ